MLGPEAVLFAAHTLSGDFHSASVAVQTKQSKTNKQLSLLVLLGARNHPVNLLPHRQSHRHNCSKYHKEDLPIAGPVSYG